MRRKQITCREVKVSENIKKYNLLRQKVNILVMAAKQAKKNTSDTS